MNAELIDSLYENEAIEAVAVFDPNEGLIENHLALNENTVTQIGASILDIRNGLQQADRALKGFVIKTPKYTFLCCFHGTSIVLLQISPGHSLERTHNTVISQLGADPSAVTPLPGTVQSLGTPTPIQQAATQPEVSPENQSNLINYSEFEHALTKILKPIATSVIAGKMIKKAIAKSGLAIDTDSKLAPEQAIQLGQDVIAQIPNAKKRKIIQNEYDALVQQYQ